MKKFLTVALLCGFVGMPAWGDSGTCNETWVTAKFRFGCDSLDQGANDEYDYGDVIQTVGVGQCYDNPAKHYNARIKCRDDDGSDDNWDYYAGEMCGDSWLQNSEDDNGLYSVKVGSEVKSEYISRKDESRSDGWKNGCLVGYCKKDYVLAPGGSKCIPLKADCKESDVKFSGNVAGEWKATGGNVGVYCFKAADLQKTRLASDGQTNICLANKHKIRNVKHPDKYWSCNTEGKWIEQIYPNCGDGSECDKGSAGCIAVPYDNSTNEVIVSASGTGQDWVLDTGSTVCVKWQCNPATHVKSKNGCITKEQKSQNDAAAASQKQKANACKNSGGSWSSGKCKCSAVNTAVSGGVCVCESGHEWVNNSDKKQGCKLTDIQALENACKAVATAEWRSDIGKCVCKNKDQTFSMERRECLDDEDYALCKRLETHGEAKWYTETKECLCVKEGYILDGGKCVESQELIAAREEERKRQEAAEIAEKLKKSRRKISDSYNALRGMLKSFKVSVWKDEEGKFNTARLASDSIAAVVLGTTGALVTSHVVKKNQVENGFEDIKCTIGGQTVADWGDEFRVGIQ